MPSPRNARGVRSLAALASVGVLSAGVLASTAPVAGAASGATPDEFPSPAAAAATSAFNATSTYPVYLNRPEGDPIEDETVAEISTVTEDGNTLIYTDATGKRVGFLDITDPAAPKGLGTVSLAVLGDTDDQPTSVAVRSDYVLVVVDTSDSFTDPSGRLDVIRLSDRERVRSIDLGGQPDSIAISGDQRYGAVAIENQRDEDLAPEGGEDGDLPQLPSGFVQVLDFTGDDPAAWTATAVRPSDDATGEVDPVVAAAGLDTPEDAEPEYVTINDANQLAVTLQENNGVLLIDLAAKEITGAFSAGTATVRGVDTEDDGQILPTETVTVPREPDAIAWVDDTHVATANEGDWKGGSRGWTVFDTTTGKVVWDARASFENIAIRYGFHNDNRSDNKGAEPEGISVATYDGHRYAFVGSERSNFVAVYDVDDPASPQLLQVLPTLAGPEGLLPIPSRGLFAVSSETDDAGVNLRAGVTLFALEDGRPAFPSIQSSFVGGKPVPWTALSSLAAVPGKPGQLVAVSDNALAAGKLYAVTVPKGDRPAKITGVTTITEGGAPAAIDAEGVSVRTGGGYWIAHEGATGPENALLRVSPEGRVQQRISLPAEITDHVGKWGLEGVSSVGAGASESVFVVLQRPLFADPAKATGELDGAGVTRIGRYDVAARTWTWFGYQSGSTTTAGDWIGVSEVTALDRRTLVVVERDKLSGPQAAVKKAVTVKLPADGAAGTLPMTRVVASLDLLPALRATNGWTQEKVEGFTVDAAGQAYAVTDNDAVQDATGQTVFLRWGTLPRR